MRAMDCSDPGTHEDMHFTAGDDDALFAKIKAHRDQYHSELTDDQIRQLISANAYDA
jgi:predicted small metal-binding protein